MGAVDDLKDYATHKSNPTGYWDPLRLAEFDFWDQGRAACFSQTDCSGYLEHPVG